MLKMALARTAETSAFSQLLTALERVVPRAPDRLAVLTYHRVDWPGRFPHLTDGLISADPDAFERQMRYLAANYHVISMARLLERDAGGTPLPPRAVLLTFDDAYGDFAEHAWPSLQRYGLPATVFVPTAYPDNPEHAFWWDRLHVAVARAPDEKVLDTPVGRLSARTAAARTRAYKQLCNYVKTQPHHMAMAWLDQFCAALGVPPAPNRVLGWSTLQALHRDGVTLGAHTRTHPLLNRLPLREAQAEVIESMHDLARQVGTCPPILAFPGGGLSPEILLQLERLGVRLGFTTDAGTNRVGQTPPLQLRRINVTPHNTLGVLRARLLH